MKKLLAAFAALLLFGVPAGRALAGDTLGDVKKKGLLVAGVKGASPPFGFVDRDTGALSGYDVDIVHAVAARLGVKAVLTTVTASSRVEALVDGNVDIVAATMAKTPDREKMVDFSDTYYLTSQKVIARKGAVKTLADLNGKRVGTARGSAWELNVKMNVPGATTVPFDNGLQATRALAGGEIDAVSTDEVLLARLLSTLPSGAYEIAPVRISEEPYGLAVRKGDKSFLDAVNVALRDMGATGESRRIYDRWFGRAPAAVPAGAAGGVVVRKTADMKRFAVMPFKGTFRPGAEVSFFDPGGTFIAKGRVKSFYTDEIYVDAEAGKADFLDYGFVVVMNLSEADAKALIRKNQDLLGTITSEIRKEDAARVAEIGKEEAAMARQRRQEQLEFEKLKMQYDYVYDYRYYGWGGSWW